MPLFEYTCEDCHERSELLINGQTEPECPKCGGRKMHKEFSTFATSGDTHGSSSGGHKHSAGCGCCMGPQGPCGLN